MDTCTLLLAFFYRCSAHGVFLWAYNLTAPLPLPDHSLFWPKYLGILCPLDAQYEKLSATLIWHV